MNNLAALALVALLGHDSFAVRQSASESLAKLGPAAVPALLASLDSQDPEIRWRGGQLLGRERGRAIESLFTSLRCLPYIDALPPDWPGRCEIVEPSVSMAAECGFARSVYAEGKRSDYPAYREATRLWISGQLIGNGMTFAEARTLLAVMVERSRCYDECGGRWPEALPAPMEGLSVSP